MLIAPIEAYRRFISPVLPPRCRFHPSCSAYALEALRTHGPVAGILLAGWRVMRCHPFHPGGYDPVPSERPRWAFRFRRARNRRLSGATR
ncbi:membrane protein insertion efficiency factor YidD [Cryptosporangium sp. NPDC051539]|uniref:membrane protein insertion efficiency factor YidD n=1 Tax=Cryptosporangium sp. NPDC051539 TaxID=3363962 RepID=UPI00378AB386